MRKRFVIFTAMLILISIVTIHAETAADPFLSDFDHAQRIIEECNPFIQMIRESNPDFPSKPFEHPYDTLLRIIDVSVLTFPVFCTSLSAAAKLFLRTDLLRRHAKHPPQKSNEPNATGKNT